MRSMSRVVHTVYRGVDLIEQRVGTNDLSLYRENRGKQNWTVVKGGKPDGYYCVGGYEVNVMLHKSRELPRLLQPD